MSLQIARRGFFCLVLGLLALAVRAETVKGLYEANVPVAGQDEQARAAAVDVGFRDVLVKVAGSARVLDNPAVAATLSRANNYLLQFYFTRIAYPPRDAGPAEEPGLHVVFPPRTVDDILRRAGEPILPPNRPATLLWLALDDGAGPRLLSRAVDTTVADWLGFHAARRAMPLLFPQMDIEDSVALTPEQAWALDAEATRRASARYGAESVLVGRLVRASDGSWLGEWRYLGVAQDSAGQPGGIAASDAATGAGTGSDGATGDGIAGDGATDALARSNATGSDGSGSAPTLDAIAGQIADFTADAVAARYAVQTGLANTEQLRLRVDGVASFGAYEKLSRLLKAMTSVRGLQLVLIDRDTLFFDVVTDSDFASVARELSLLSQLGNAGAEGELHYRWVGG
jgi:hypothetical protein